MRDTVLALKIPTTIMYTKNVAMISRVHVLMSLHASQ